MSHNIYAHSCGANVKELDYLLFNNNGDMLFCILCYVSTKNTRWARYSADYLLTLRRINSFAMTSYWPRVCGWLLRVCLFEPHCIQCDLGRTRCNLWLINGVDRSVSLLKMSVNWSISDVFRERCFKYFLIYLKLASNPSSETSPRPKPSFSRMTFWYPKKNFVRAPQTGGIELRHPYSIFWLYPWV